MTDHQALSASGKSSARSVLEASSPSSLRLPRLLSLLLIAGLATYIGWANFGYAYDDAFITYRVSYNFATGQGLVYNPGEWFLGITTPGLALLLGIAGRLFGPDTIPVLGSLVSAIAHGLAGLALYVYGSRYGHAAGGLFAGLLLIANQMLALNFSGEMPLQVALILWAFVAYAADRRIAGALLLAAATVVRPDAVLAAIVIGLFDLVRTRRIAWRMWLAFALAVLPFALLAWIYYGSPLPVTLAAKLAHRDSGVWPTFGRRLRSWFNMYMGPNGYPANWEFISWDPRALGFWVVIGAPALLWYRFWWLPFAWVVTFTMSYRTLQVPFYHWYAAPAVVGVVIVASAGIESVLTLLLTRLASPAPPAPSLASPARRPYAPVVAATAGVLLCLAINLPLLRELPTSSAEHPMLQIYEQAGRWLHANVPPEATIGYFEIGYLGYYARRPVIDPLGLFDPAIPPHIAKRDFLWAYRQHPPSYILERSDNSYGGIRGEAWFSRDYQPIKTFSHPTWQVNLTVFQRIATDRGLPASR
jgi:arabinofuranosyltransferase